ncbi:hypothetical protein EI77_02933 [Prosthecobacter fusiformis]|uniref:Uncharacterized protein n=1 Tax=Prosthecobacter fusiformis TaxID=48464 RepID=A0A4R7RU71_9BACT|nr:hypothetical protein [Prosthecobacter fusiformis]TDU69282.1 hypothetical protein EI77_02933 [Prosthecobacter fusiformis]
MTTSTIQSLKLTLVSAVGLSKDALHVHIGLAVFVLVMVIFKRPLRSLIPWLAAFGIACLGEAVDMRDDLSSLGHWRWQASLHDVMNTAFWPTAFFLLARFSSLTASRKTSSGS